LVLADVRLEGCDRANSALRGASIDRVELIGCRLTGFDLGEASLRHMVARQCGGSLVSFRFAEVKSSRFEDCVLTEADFQDAKLPAVLLRGCDLSGASRYGASLAGADLRGSQLDGLRMRASDLAGAVIDSIQPVALARTRASLAGITVRSPQEDENDDC
jgi:uncharacterized protein YjbI with pentapeptide repeats